MVDQESAMKILDAMCECEPDIDVSCPMCLIKSYVETIAKAETNVKDLKIQVKVMKESHFIHLDALNNYYHIIHKRCPCKSEGKCESPWLNQAR